MRNPPRIARGKRGLTLLELLVSIVVGSLLMAGIYRIFLFVQKQSLVQRRIAQYQSRLFPAQASLEKNLRRASQGIPRTSQILSGNAAQSRPAVQIYANVGPDSITVRGNFTGDRSQLRNPVASSAAGTYLDLVTGTAGRFAVGNYIVLVSIDTSEHVKVTERDLANSRIRTEARLMADYPAGTTVNRVSEVRYQIAPDSSLRLIQATGTSVLLEKHVTDLSFQVIGRGGAAYSVPPGRLDTARFIAYSLTARIPKLAGQYFHRTVSGKLLLRN